MYVLLCYNEAVLIFLITNLFASVIICVQDVCNNNLQILNCHPSIDSSYRLLLLCVLHFSVR